MTVRRHPARRYFIAGLLVWVPLTLTVLIFRLIMQWLDASLVLVPRVLRPQYWLGFEIPGLGLLLTVAVVFATGIFAANFLGQRVIRWGESVVARIPVVRSVYGGLKAMTETLLADNSQAFRRAVLVQYPRQGVWMIGFVTGTPEGEVQTRVAERVVSVFIPTTPNPTSGWIAMIPQRELVPLDMSVEEAMKFVISLGVVYPRNAAAPATQPSSADPLPPAREPPPP